MISSWNNQFIREFQATEEFSVHGEIQFQSMRGISVQGGNPSSSGEFRGEFGEFRFTLGNFTSSEFPPCLDDHPLRYDYITACVLDVDLFLRMNSHR